MNTRCIAPTTKSATDRAAASVMLLALLVVAHGLFMLQLAPGVPALWFHLALLASLALTVVLFWRRWVLARREAAWDHG